MTIFKSILVASVMTVFFVSCAEEVSKDKKPAVDKKVISDSKEKVLADAKQIMKDMTAVFKKIQDVESAKSATPKLVELTKMNLNLDQRLIALNLDKAAIGKETKGDEELVKIKKEFEQELKRKDAMDDVRKVFAQERVSN